MGRYTVHRQDTTAKALIAYAESLGFIYLELGVVIDGILAYGQRIVAVDWKSAGGTLTPKQQRLIARGFPVRFISTPAQLEAVKAELGQ